jgi:SAM-dependent methyltransferase
MSIQRVALIFDDQARPETTGVYCLRALRRLVAVEHFRPADLDRIPREGFDLYLRIDDGFDYRLPAGLRPCAWWVIDTHLNFERDVARAADFDLVFAAQRDGAEGLRREGVASAAWLPLACDPEVHAKHEVEKAYDLCFVGNVSPGPRADLLGLLQRHYPGMFVGRLYFEEMARAYSAVRLVFNRSVRNDVNMRVFEAAACGSLLLTNDLADNGQAELFRDGVHLAAYREAEELLDKAKFYLARADSRERVAAAGRAQALARHTYRHRMERLLAEAERGLAQTAAAVPAAAPTAPPAGSPPAGGGAPLGPDRSYYECARPEVLARVPTTARRVLDVGCGAGRLGEALKARQPAEVVGIELDPEAAAAARGRLDRVVCGDVERLGEDFGPAAFDAVVAGDVLEHLRDPAALLRKVRRWLKPGGRLVASVPNVGHHTVVRGLLAGDWTYESAGLLDHTHLRFFTRRSFGELLARCGFAVEAAESVPGPGDAEAAAGARAGAVHVGRLRLEGLPPEEAEEFFTYQYLVTARPGPEPGEGPADGLPPLGCVLAVRDRPADVLERTLQTYAFQSPPPLDKVLLDYGSAAPAAAAYRGLCRRYGWRYIRPARDAPEWHLADAYNQAVAALDPDVEVVFKNDADVLLGEGVLAAAARLGRDRLCLFSRLTTAAGAAWPGRFDSPSDVTALLGADPPPAPMESERVQAFPRRWFIDVGGFDLAYRGWGYEDSDLRLRADWSVGVARVATPLLVHQGHPRGAPDPRTARNRAYYDGTKASRRVVRNRGAGAGAAGEWDPSGPEADRPTAGARVLNLAEGRHVPEGADAEAPDPAPAGGPFDAVLCGRLPERTRDPSACSAASAAAWRPAAA